MDYTPGTGPISRLAAAGGRPRPRRGPGFEAKLCLNTLQSGELQCNRKVLIIKQISPESKARLPATTPAEADRGLIRGFFILATEFDIKTTSGLSEAEAGRRLQTEGPNELPQSKKRSIFAIALGVVREPMLILLIACGAIYLAVGDLAEALVLLSFVFVIMGITFYQERKTERTLEALRDLSSPRALVIRDGQQKRIAGREVVRGDIVMLKEGDRVPADAILLACSNLMAEESLLTGESVPVRKISCPPEGPQEMGRPGGDGLPGVYSGTMVVGGQGVAVVTATGARTEIGKIGRSLQSMDFQNTRLQKETGRFVRNIAIIGACLCLILLVIYGLTIGGWIPGLLASLTLAMAILPEEFPVVLTIFMALGAWRISQSQVLTRRVPVIETLGSATVLCVDKTGTLTQNRMSVSQIEAGDKFFTVQSEPGQTLSETFHELVEFSILASQRDPFDPMEKALKDMGERYLKHTEHLHGNWTLVRAYPLSPQLLALSHVWKSPDGRDYIIAAKGAPEAIADLCHLDEAKTRELGEHIGVMADNGLRVLGIARAEFKHTDLPGEQHDFNFRFIGLVGFADPIRPEVPEAVRDCYSAGMRVVMITGDYPATARNIGRQIGLKNLDEVVTGSELEKMSPEELGRRIKNVSIFARVMPEQKLGIVNAFKASGEVVAMTGDGVNDAPALKSADIGIAMGARGTDVAREAAGLVLLDDAFSSIVKAVSLGRRVFDNLKKAMAYILAIHVPIAGLSLIPVLFGWPLILMPVHVVFLELIIDPACSVVFEAERAEKDVMKRPPRRPKEPLFSRRTITVSMMQGFSVLAVTLVVFCLARYQGMSADESRALTFTTLIIANLGLIITNRSWTHTVFSTFRNPNTALWAVLGGASAFMALVLYVPFLSNLFQFAPLSGLDILICVGAGVASVVWFEILKFFYGHRGGLRQFRAKKSGLASS
jgi:Ca2+-transporting ATPase